MTFKKSTEQHSLIQIGSIQENRVVDQIATVMWNEATRKKKPLYNHISNIQLTETECMRWQKEITET